MSALVDNAELAISIHALLAESDCRQFIRCICNLYFYPRSPCGERHRHGAASRGRKRISIHALLAESDPLLSRVWFTSSRFLSTLSLRRATADRTRLFCDIDISIHALLAESDVSCTASSKLAAIFLSTLSLRRATPTPDRGLPQYGHFYPRSPCGERQRPLLGEATPLQISIHALLAESDVSVQDFQRQAVLISIHALLAESDQRQCALYGRV